MTEQAKPAGTATLSYGDKSVELPVLAGSTGPDHDKRFEAWAVVGDERTWVVDTGFEEIEMSPSMVKAIASP